MSDDLKTRIQDDVKAAMRARDRARLGVLRLITAAVKQKEIDERATPSNSTLRPADRIWPTRKLSR